MKQVKLMTVIACLVVLYSGCAMVEEIAEAVESKQNHSARLGWMASKGRIGESIRYFHQPARVPARLYSGADPAAKDKSGRGRSPADDIARNRHLKKTPVAKRLRRAAAVSCVNWNTRKFFENATETDVTKCLRKDGADVNARSKSGGTPLHWAVSSSKTPSVIEALLKAGADVNARNKTGSTPLHWAVSYSSYSKARNSKTHSVIEVLLKAGADVNARNKNGFTPLRFAGYWRATPLAKRLRRAAARAAAVSCVNWNTRKFFENATETDVTKCLRKDGADVNARSKSGGTPLHRAARYSKTPSVIEVLLKAGADINARNKTGSTPLHWAAMSSSRTPSVIEVLLKAGADINARNKTGSTPLHRAARYSKTPSVIEVLLKAGADINARNKTGSTPLHWAAMSSSRTPSVIDALLKAGADIAARNKHGDTPLHWAARYGKIPSVIEVLLDAGADPAAKDKSGRGRSPADDIAINRHLKKTPVAKRLRRAAAVPCVNWNTRKFFENATETDVTKCLRKDGADVNARSKSGGTPLHWVARYSKTPSVIEALLKAGADINARDKKGNTPLHWAVRYSKTPSVIEALLKAGADVNARDKKGNTPLHWAARYSRTPTVIEVLLDAGADPAAKDKSGRGRSPADDITRNRHLKKTLVVKRLRRAAAVSCVNWNTRKFFENATETDVTKCLRKDGADVHVRDKKGNTLLHLAARFSKVQEVVAALTKAGADVNARRKNGWTPLHAAAVYGGYWPVSAALLKAGADVNAVDRSGWTPLHWAVQADADPALMRVLLNAGANPAARNGDGAVPWDFVESDSKLSGTGLARRLRKGKGRAK